MRFPLTDRLIDEARRFELRSACRDCLFWRPGPRSAADPTDGECLHGWPDEGQRRWPLDAPDEHGARPAEAAFCKEFELR